MPSFLAYRLGLMSHLGSTFSKNDVPGPWPGGRKKAQKMLNKKHEKKTVRTGQKWIQPGPRARAQGCASWARNPKGPKSHLFVTNWVAIQPFCTSLVPGCAEFRRGSRQIGPTPSISTHFFTFLDQFVMKNVIF